MINKWQRIAERANVPMFGSSDSGSSSGGSSSTMTPAQKEYYDKLLAGAGGWLDNGGLVGTGNEYLGQAEEALGNMAGFYGDVLTGGVDQAMLDEQLAIQARHAQDGLDSQVTSISDSANQTGGAGGSRQGVAEGMAVSEANQNLTDAQTGLINDTYEQEMARKMGAAQGMGSVAQGYGGIQDKYKSDQEQALSSLAAFQGLISGDMGGTTDTENWGQEDSGGRGWELSDDNMKENVRKVGSAVTNGYEIGLYEFEYTDEAKLRFKSPEGIQTGVMASEVERFNPEAVTYVDDIRVVNYDLVEV